MTKCSECSNNEEFDGSCLGGLLWDTTKIDCPHFARKEEEKKRVAMSKCEGCRHDRPNRPEHHTCILGVLKRERDDMDECDSFKPDFSVKKICSINKEGSTQQAPKHDTNPYEKVDLSLVPWDLLSADYHNGTVKNVQENVHNFLNNKDFGEPFYLIRELLSQYGSEPLAIAFGYGAAKYWRDSWKEGFNGDYQRILKALLRHGDAFLKGTEYDNEPIGDYIKGTSHVGAIMWCLVVGKQEWDTSKLVSENESKTIDI